MAISNGSKELAEVLHRMKELLDRKSEDYSDQSDLFSNFFKTGAMTGLGTEASFKLLIATKVARVMELTGSSREPSNESVDDTILDLANYSALWLAWRTRQRLLMPDQPLWKEEQS